MVRETGAGPGHVLLDETRVCLVLALISGVSVVTWIDGYVR